MLSSIPLPMNLKISKNDGEKLSNPIVYQSLVDILLYLTITTLDLIFLVSLLLWRMTLSSEIHFGVVKRVLIYLKGTLNFCIWFENVGNINLHSFCDSN